MLRFAWANTDSMAEADAVLIGVPDESGSHALRRGAKFAPGAIRRATLEREVFEREGVKTTALPGIVNLDLKLFDRGDVGREEVPGVVASILRRGIIPVVLGGDHSLTAQVLNGFEEASKSVGVVYFDAHPDFICSTSRYFGSVICDISKYKHVDFSKSVEIGIRSPEPEEVANLRREHLLTITPTDILVHGIKWVVEQLHARGLEEVYISFDMDAVDPAFAPGVSTPVPGGLSSATALGLVGLIAREFRVVGVDIMEVSPPYDIQDMTAHLAGRIVMEAIKT